VKINCFWKSWTQKALRFTRLSRSEEAQSFLQGFSFPLQSKIFCIPTSETRDRTRIIICSACLSTSLTRRSCLGRVASFRIVFRCWCCSERQSAYLIVDNLPHSWSSCSWSCSLVWSTAFGCLCCRLNCSCSSTNCSFVANSCLIFWLPLSFKQ